MDPPSKQDGRVPRNEWYKTCQNTRSFPTAHLDPTAPEASQATLSRVRVPERGGAGPPLRHHEASHGALGSARLRSGGKNTSIPTKAWRHLSSTFEEATRIAARAAHEHPNGTLFDETDMEQEEPPEETDLILHDDDDGDDVEDPESAVSNSGCRSRTRRTLLVT